ncbi:MAG: protein kinase [Deltaproteobacteria bacterium]|nr:protein kinase [Deltaproteobacteria bacterium]
MECIRCGVSFDSFEGPCPSCDWNLDDILDKTAGYRPGEVVRGRYEIRESLGLGRLGTVIRAVDQEVGIEVALKIIHPALTPNKKIREKFLASMQPMSQIKHKSMTRLFGVDRDEDGRCYIVRQLLEGVPLRRLSENRRVEGNVFSLEEILPIIEQIVGFFNENENVVHGALSPEKIWILPQHLKVTDVGLASHLPPAAVWHRLKKGGRSRGYAAPELSLGQHPDTRADVYSLGALVGELLTQVAFNGQSNIFADSDPDLPNKIDVVLRQALEKEPSARYNSPADFLAALHDLQTGGKVAEPIQNTDVYRTPVEEPPVQEDTLTTHPPVREVDDVFDDTAQVSMEAVIRAHAESQDSSAKKAPPPKAAPPKAKASQASQEQTSQRPPYRPTDLGALAQAVKRETEGEPKRPPTRRASPPARVDRPVASPPTSKSAPIEPRRPSPPSRDTRPPSYVPPPSVSRADDPILSDRDATPRGMPEARKEPTQEIALSELEAVEESPERREVTQEIELDMIEEEVGTRSPDEIANRLEKQAANAERESAEELLRRARRLDGVDPRLVRAAHSLESDRRGARSRQAAQILRQRAESLDGIDPRFLRAAARLEETKVSGVEESEEIDKEGSAASELPDDEWQDRIEPAGEEDVISFLAPPVIDRPADVRGFPKNQKRGAENRTATPKKPAPAPAPRPRGPRPPKRS